MGPPVINKPIWQSPVTLMAFLLSSFGWVCEAYPCPANAIVPLSDSESLVTPYQGLRLAPVAGGLTCQLQVASVPRQTSAAAGRALGAHRHQRRWQVLGNTIYHDICS